VKFFKGIGLRALELIKIWIQELV